MGEEVDLVTELIVHDFISSYSGGHRIDMSVLSGIIKGAMDGFRRG